MNQFYEDQDARIPIMARSMRLREKAGYIEADQFNPSMRNGLRTGGGPYIQSALLGRLMSVLTEEGTGPQEASPAEDGARPAAGWSGKFFT